MKSWLLLLLFVVVVVVVVVVVAVVVVVEGLNISRIILDQGISLTI
jgi:hypothetical protein